jgi:hypothetical protein
MCLIVFIAPIPYEKWANSICVPEGRRTGTFRGSLNVPDRVYRAYLVREMGQPHMRPVRDATRIARHFSAGIFAYLRRESRRDG